MDLISKNQERKKFELNINYDLDACCFHGEDNHEIITWWLRSVKNYDALQEVQDFSDFSSWLCSPAFTKYKTLNNFS